FLSAGETVLSCRLAFQAESLHRAAIRAVQSRDPNDKVGSQGSGSARFVTGSSRAAYEIFFENTSAATAAAQEVVITDRLDPARLDLSTFSLSLISFGSHLVTPPPGLSQYSTDIDLRPGDNLILRINAGLDQSTGLATWRFTSLDPATMLP